MDIQHLEEKKYSKIILICNSLTTNWLAAQNINVH